MNRIIEAVHKAISDFEIIFLQDPFSYINEYELTAELYCRIKKELTCIGKQYVEGFYNETRKIEKWSRVNISESISNPITKKNNYKPDLIIWNDLKEPRLKKETSNNDWPIIIAIEIKYGFNTNSYPVQNDIKKLENLKKMGKIEQGIFINFHWSNKELKRIEYLKNSILIWNIFKINNT